MRLNEKTRLAVFSVMHLDAFQQGNAFSCVSKMRFNSFQQGDAFSRVARDAFRCVTTNTRVWMHFNASILTTAFRRI